ncbi:MAG: acetyltransferase [Flavobacteriales bacterium]
MSKTLAIIGSGDLGQQLAHYAISDNHFDKVVFIDDFESKSEVNGHKIVGKIKDIQSLFDANVFDELLIGIGYRHLEFKKKLFISLSSKIPFATLIHSSAWVDPTSKIGAGTVIFPRCIIDAKAVINQNCLLNVGCSISHDSTIDSHCFLSPRVAVAGFVSIQESCILGINSTVIDNISIKKGSQLGGGAVVINTIKKSGLYVGNPSRFIR